MTNADTMTFTAGQPFDCRVFARELSYMAGSRNVIFLCIGTDSSTGDSLGPLTGYLLSDVDCETFRVVGSLFEPVTALNICQITQKLSRLYPDFCTVAIDAALGKPGLLGQITLSKRPLRPGLGMKKLLPEVGEVSITGVIGETGEDFCALSNTRLSLVMDIAKRISLGITAYCCGNY